MGTSEGATGDADEQPPSVPASSPPSRTARSRAQRIITLVERARLQRECELTGQLPNAYHSLPRSPLSSRPASPISHPFAPKQTGLDIDQGEPSFVESFRTFFFGSWINILLVTVPLSFVSKYLGWGATYDFWISFVAIIPLASLLGDATEQCALRLGQTIGGLLNATFGNAVEAIVGVLALSKGELVIVQTSMLGSILSNLLLVLGCSFLAAGTREKEAKFQTTAAGTSSSMMVLACATLVIPAAYHASRIAPNPKEALDVVSALGNKSADLDGLLTISRGTALILLFCYGTYLYFQLSSHAFLFEDEADHEEEHPTMNLTAAITGLVGITVITSFCADNLVGAIDEFAANSGVSKPFLGLVLLPIVGNACEHFTAVLFALKGKYEVVIGVCCGSSIQIALLVIPVLVVAGWIIGQPLSLFFGNLETISLFVSVLLVHFLIQDGKSNYMEGVMLVSLYLVIGLCFWCSD